MNISSGLSEINLNPADRQQKIYVWPKYRQEPVEPVKKVIARTEGNVYYSKPTEAEKQAIFKNMNDMNNLTYTRDTFVKNNIASSVKPGSLFDALA